MTQMLQEFRDFVLRGNIVELAIAFVMGVAFAAVVNSFVDDILKGQPHLAVAVAPPFNERSTRA